MLVHVFITETHMNDKIIDIENIIEIAAKTLWGVGEL